MARIAVVTGAGRGFGLEIARRLAGRGYEVLCTDIDEQAAARTAERVGGFSLALDVRDPEAHRAAARAAVERGRLEVDRVNNAGVLRTVKAWEHSDEELRLLVEVNLLGVIYGSRAAIEAMRSEPGDNRHIINLASLSALSPVPGLAVYAATKHGVLGFTTSLQGDLERGHPQGCTPSARTAPTRTWCASGPATRTAPSSGPPRACCAPRRWPSARSGCSIRRSSWR